MPQPAKSQSVAGNVTQKKPNNTGLPDNLKSGIENLSGYSMDDVKVHYNSGRPAQLQAHAFAQGNQIHIGPGQEKHLPHEAWHVVQQKQGRVRPTIQLKSSVSVNDNLDLEKKEDSPIGNQISKKNEVIQRVIHINFQVANPNPTLLRQHVELNHYSINELQNAIFFLNQNNAQFKDVKNFIHYLGFISQKLHNLNRFAQDRIQANINPIRQQYATLIIGASHTGDMYHLKAARALFPNLNVLICSVNEHDLSQAYQIGSYLNNPTRTYYTDAPKPTNTASNQELRGVTHGVQINWNRWIDEGQSTTLIMAAHINSNTGGATEGVVLEQGTAPIPAGSNYGQILQSHNFNPGVPYVLVNFRQSGHGAGTAPALDTGTTGYAEIINLVRQNVPGATIVPMGDIMPAGQFPVNLVNYWKWKGVETREQQAGLLRYLNQHYTVTGAVGMRSGIMDSLAFAGIRIISIDISPHKGGQTIQGWQRGSKLERAYGPAYGRVFIKYPRTNETAKGNPWTGSFHANDQAAIGAAIQNYLGGGALLAPNHKDPSHPLSVQELRALINRVAGQVVPTPPQPPYPQPQGPISAVDRRDINNIKDLLATDYARVPFRAAYSAILTHFVP